MQVDNSFTCSFQVTVCDLHYRALEEAIQLLLQNLHGANGLWTVRGNKILDRRSESDKQTNMCIPKNLGNRCVSSNCSNLDVASFLLEITVVRTCAFMANTPANNVCSCIECLQETNGECMCKCIECSAKQDANYNGKQQGPEESHGKDELSRLRTERDDLQSLLGHLDKLERDCLSLHNEYEKERRRWEQAIQAYPRSLQAQVAQKEGQIRDLERSHRHRVMEFSTMLDQDNDRLSQLREEDGLTLTRKPFVEVNDDGYGTPTEDVLVDLDRLQGILGEIRGDIEERKSTLVQMTIHYEKLLSQSKLEINHAVHGLNDDLERKQLTLKNFDVEQAGLVDNLKNRVREARAKLEDLDASPPKRLTPLLADSKRYMLEVRRLTATLDVARKESSDKIAVVVDRNLKAQEGQKCNIASQLSLLKSRLAGAKAQFDLLGRKEQECARRHKERLLEMEDKVRMALEHKEAALREAEAAHRGTMRDLGDAYDVSNQQLVDRRERLGETETKLHVHYEERLTALRAEIASAINGGTWGVAEINLPLDEDCKLIGELTTMIEHERHRLQVIVDYERRLNRFEYGDLMCYLMPHVQSKEDKMRALTKLLHETASGIDHAESESERFISKASTKADLEKSAKMVENNSCAVKSITKQIEAERDVLNKHIRAVETTINEEEQRYLEDKQKLLKETCLLVGMFAKLVAQKSKYPRKASNLKTSWQDLSSAAVQLSANGIKLTVGQMNACMNALRKMKQENGTVKRHLRGLQQRRKLLALLVPNMHSEEEIVIKLKSISRYFVKENRRLGFERSKLQNEIAEATAQKFSKQLCA